MILFVLCKEEIYVTDELLVLYLVTIEREAFFVTIQMPFFLTKIMFGLLPFKTGKYTTAETNLFGKTI